MIEKKNGYGEERRGKVLFTVVSTVHVNRANKKKVPRGFVPPADRAPGQQLLCSLPAGSCWKVVFPCCGGMRHLIVPEPVHRALCPQGINAKVDESSHVEILE